jgi:protein-S-isoprenylcysteine O-methyltransferase Ste14
MYDTFMRLPLLGWGLFAATGQLASLIQLTNRESLNLVYAIHIAMRLSMIAFILLVSAAVLLRTRPSAKAGGLEPRVSALAGSFLMYGMMLFPRHGLSLSQEIVSTLLTTIGSAGAVVALWQLGRSFSIMAESRQLVTSGPYRFVRHPLYAAEQIATVGVFMQFASIYTALLLAAHITFQLRRMRNEEQVLTTRFPEYAAYSHATARLLPGIY